MRTLEKKFKKNKIFYETVKRNNDVGLFKLFVKEDWMKEQEHIGWEISRILKNKEFIIKGNVIPACESLPSNDQFGLELDGDKAMFPQEMERALEYFDDFSTRMASKRLEREANKA